MEMVSNEIDQLAFEKSNSVKNSYDVNALCLVAIFCVLNLHAKCQIDWKKKVSLQMILTNLPYHT